MSVDVFAIIETALAGHNVYGPGEPVKPRDADLCLRALNQILDDWNAEGQSSIAAVFTPFTTTAALQPHTIGPTGTWVLPVRPVTIDGAALSIGGGLWTPIGVTDDPQWWNERSAVSSGTLANLYYAATVPNGALYFDGVPAGGETVRLMTRTVLAALTLAASVDLAPGYESALTLTLQEAIAEAFNKTVSASLEKRAGKARARIWHNNLRMPSLSTRGQGLPGTPGGYWDYRSGTWR